MTVPVLLDPALLAVPNMAMNESEVEEIFGLIVEWAGRVRDRWPILICQPSFTAEVLAEVGSFPVAQSINELLVMCNLSHVFSAEDIRRAIVTILDRCETVSEHVGFEVIDCDNVQSDPDIFFKYSPERLKRSMACVLATVAMSDDRRAVFTVPGVLSVGPKVTISCRVNSVQNVLRGWQLPLVLKGSPAQLVYHYDDVFDRLNPEDVWADANDDREFCFAIALEAAALVASASGLGRRNIRAVPRFYLGTGFVASLERLSATGRAAEANITRETCARIVLGSPKQEVGFLHDGAGRPLVRRDGAIARRTHITKHGIGLRLMYWELGQRMEFANIGPKSELRIEMGEPEAATDLRIP